MAYSFDLKGMQPGFAGRLIEPLGLCGRFQGNFEPRLSTVSFALRDDVDLHMLLIIHDSLHLARGSLLGVQRYTSCIDRELDSRWRWKCEYNRCWMTDQGSGKRRMCRCETTVGARERHIGLTIDHGAV
jgi:hypothetical protein